MLNLEIFIDKFFSWEAFFTLKCKSEYIYPIPLCI